MRSKHTEVPSPGIAAFIGFAAEAKPTRFESVRVSAFASPLTFVFKQVTRWGRKEVYLRAPPFVGPFSRSVGAQSNTQP